MADQLLLDRPEETAKQAEAHPTPTAFSVFDYFDYRRCLDGFYKYRKSLNSRFSHRSFALKAGYKSSGLFIQLVKGKLNLTRKMLPGFIRAMGLGGAEGEYFGLMVNFTHARNAVARQHWFQMMIPLLPSAAKTVAMEQKKYYENWYNVAIREALSILDISDDFEEIADFIQPPIAVGQARASMELLAGLGMIRRDRNGFWRGTDAILASSPDLGPFLIHSYQGSLIDLGKEALQRYERELRNVACLTFSLSEQGHQRLNLKVESFFNDVLELVRSDEGMDRVGQLNIQYFPLSKQKTP
ncbi:MAG: hypothetical protein JWO30_1711 [Fibrobacteres bacterium]|nr:hypothetical protein [Fibrobacterota bacterium]